MTRKTARRIAILCLVLIVFIGYQIAYCQDTTTVRFDSPSGYKHVLLEVPVSFTFKEATTSVEGLLKLDHEKAFYLGMRIGHSSALAHDNKAAIDSVRWAIAWTDPVAGFDTLLVFQFIPLETGSFMYDLSFLEFDERVPANDGVTFVPGQTEIYPFDAHPGFVNTEEYVEKSAACDWIRNFTMLKSDVGDVTGNGDISPLDGSRILQYTVGIIDRFEAQDSLISILPSFCN